MGDIFSAVSAVSSILSVGSKLFGGKDEAPAPPPPPPPPPVTPPVVMPVADDEAAKKKRAMQLSASRSSRGRQGTILSDDTSGSDLLGG